MLSFPFLKAAMVPAFRFDDFTGVWVFIDLNLAGFTCGFRFRYLSATTCMWIKQVDHVLQAVSVFCEQIAQLRFEFNFFLKTSVALQGLERLKLFGEMFFKLAKFCEFRHGSFLSN
ncbi:hypothetical protein AOA59_27865 [Pseudomonas sp. 2822-15]|nr:hypothetical protein AOA59_27865 [Pseudomonas sp. 2822-15]